MIKKGCDSAPFLVIRGMLSLPEKKDLVRSEILTE